jgi:glycerol 2-dehydrogenase (NADP+)
VSPARSAPHICEGERDRAHGILTYWYARILLRACVGTDVCAGQPSPGKPSLLLDNEDVVRIAKAHDADPAQVLLSCGVQHGVIVIPKSENEGRMRANLAVGPPRFLPRLALTSAQVLKLSDDDMRALDALHTKEGKHRSLLDYHGDTPGGPGVFGWTYKQMGWDMGQGGVVGA